MQILKNLRFILGGSGMGVFVFVWFGQLVSLIGSGLTSFALGVWVYQFTGSVTQFSLILLFAMLPGILILNLLRRWVRLRGAQRRVQANAWRGRDYSFRGRLSPPNHYRVLFWGLGLCGKPLWLLRTRSLGNVKFYSQ